MGRSFKELTDKQLRRGVFSSVVDLTEAITIGHWNHGPKPFDLEGHREQIIENVSRGRATSTRSKMQRYHQVVGPKPPMANPPDTIPAVPLGPARGHAGATVSLTWSDPGLLRLAVTVRLRGCGGRLGGDALQAGCRRPPRFPSRLARFVLRRVSR